MKRLTLMLILVAGIGCNSVARKQAEIDRCVLQQSSDRDLFMKTALEGNDVALAFLGDMERGEEKEKKLRAELAVLKSRKSIIGSFFGWNLSQQLAIFTLISGCIFAIWLWRDGNKGPNRKTK